MAGTVPDNECEIYHKKGDVMIISDSKEMLVSSQVLSMVSPVFDRMFEPGFLEGDRKRSKDNPLRLPLDDDSPEALSLLFHILHLSPRQRYTEPDFDLLLRLAQLADKYGCLDSIRDPIERWLYSLTAKLIGLHGYLNPMPGRWFHLFTDQNSYDEIVLVKLIAISFLIDEGNAFRKSTATLLKYLSADRIERLYSQDVLPQSLKAVLRSSRKKLALHLNSITEHAISKVGQSTSRLSTRARHKRENCWYCLRDGVAACNIYDGYCDTTTRPGLLLHCLNTVGLWPITLAIEASIMDFQKAVDLLLVSPGRSLFHDCVAEDHCPLMQEFVKIKSSTQAVMDNFEWIDITDMGAEARGEFLLI